MPAAVAASDRAGERPELGRGLLAHSLLAAASGGPVDVTGWFHRAAERASSLIQKLTGARQDTQAGTRSKGFPLLASDK